MALYTMIVKKPREYSRIYFCCIFLVPGLHCLADHIRDSINKQQVLGKFIRELLRLLRKKAEILQLIPVWSIFV